ncbi:MAG: MotA/TolQ/ExbB proton channel family protein [Lentisphaeria bacterium]|nr:MotA/TolQ/ExbB proton channel family protein [Lentisphaeria bacterium]
MTALFFASAAQTPGVYYAFQNSDSVGKGIVILLIIGSVLTWTVMLDKWWSLYRAKRLSDRFESFFRDHENDIHANSLLREADNNSGPVSAVYTAGMVKLLEFYAEGGNTYRGMPAPCKLSEAQYNAIEAVLENEVSKQLQELETRIGFLATLVSLSPFLGLFGTVWGVMMAFCGIAVAGKSDFTALAPGVAGALLTTVAGLVVAIPSLVGYNLLGGTLRQLTVMMDNFTEQFMVSVKLSQLELARKSNAAAATAMAKEPEI